MLLLSSNYDSSAAYNHQHHAVPPLPALPLGTATTSTTFSRRSFFATAGFLVTAPLVSNVNAVDIKVTPLAKTFITSGGKGAKPIRENDATRYFTNARVVFLLEGTSGGTTTGDLVLRVTAERKAGRGPGVTPGNVQLLSYKSSSSSLPEGVVSAGTAADVGVLVSKISDLVPKLPEGDVLLVGPIPSRGTAGDGKLLADTASAVKSFVGGKTGGGVVSVLLDGPREGLLLEENGYPVSELLWYSL